MSTRLEETSATPPTTAGGHSAPAGPLAGLLGLAALVIIAAGIRAQAGMLGPMFLGLTLVVTAYPMVTWLRARRVPGPLATLASLVAVYAVLAAIIAAMVWSVLRLVDVMPQYLEQGRDLYQQAIDLLAGYGVEESQLEELMSSIDPQQIASLVQSLASQLSSGASLLVLLLTGLIFLVLDTGSVEKRMAVLTDQNPRAAAAFTDFARRVRSYWVVTTVFGLLVAVVDVVFLLALGIPLALTWGVFSFVTNYIPNVGFVIGLVPPMLIALLEKGPVMAVVVAVGYWAINFIAQTVIQPRVTGDMVGLNATVIFISLIVWAYLLGPLGALVAVPATIFMKAVLVDHVPGNRWLTALLGAEPRPEQAPADTPQTTA